MIRGISLISVPNVVNGKLETNPKEMGLRADEFEHLFNECVEQTLTDLLSVKAREALLDYLARHHGIARGEILSHPRELTMLLAKTFGKGGITIEKCIIRRLYATLKWEYKEASNFNFDFKLQLEEARACWETSHDAIA